MKDTQHKPSLEKRLLRRWRNLKIPNLSLRLLTTFVCLLSFAELVEINVLFPRFDGNHVRRIQEIFTRKEQSLYRYMGMSVQCTGVAVCDSCFVRFHNEHAAEMKENGLYLFVYRNDSLLYWSTKDVPVPATCSVSGFYDKAYVSLGDPLSASGKYASFVRKHSNYVIVGLALIKNVYAYENRHLKTAFQKDFGLPANVKIFPDQFDDSYPITDSNGRFMWSLGFDSTCYYRHQIYLPAFACLFAILVFFMLLDSIFQQLRSAARKNAGLPVLALLLGAIRYAMQYWQYPRVFYHLELFDPIHFGSAWFPSLGELGLWCVFCCFFTFELCKNLRFPLFYGKRRNYFINAGLSLMLVINAFIGTGLLIKTLVINSNDIFEGPNRILLLNGFSLLGYAIILLFLASFCALLHKTILLCRQEMTFRQFLISFTIVLSLTVIGWSAAGRHIDLLSVLFLIIIVYAMGLMVLKKNVKFRYSHYTLMVFISALYTALYINQYSFLKYRDQKEIIVTNLASQHDMTTEFLLRNISDRLREDTVTLARLAYDDAATIDFPNVLYYLKRQYFYDSYWNRYILNCWVCGDTVQLQINDGQWERYEENCVGYFRRMTDQGTKLARSEFWFVDRTVEGYSSYLGWFREAREGEQPLQLFIELAQIQGGVAEEAGYPELLLDSRTSQNSSMKGYSYAKYRNNRLMIQSGSYRYNLQGNIFQADRNTYHTVYADGMEHLVFRPDRDSMVVLSSYSPEPGDLVINFSYIFVFFFLVTSLCLLALYLPVIRRNFQWNFRNKIQYAMIAVMLVSFAIIGVWTVIYITRQYQNKNTDIINEKMQAIHTELQNAILFRKSMDDNWQENKDFLAMWLAEFRRIFFTDVNVFDVNGQLIETSSPDIFDRGLAGRQINPDAFIKLSFGQRASIMEHEEIGGQKYISVYEPFVDSENKVIAFLNLPYFTQQDAITEEITNVVVALVNFYMVIILLTVIVSVLVSNQITQPLIMLQQKFRSIKLGEKNEPVSYSRQDEIGALVNEYNKAIEELARSARQLARSERESAWREMAKQIAHEINNPLTPMKLSIQHLKRAYDNKSERFNEYMEKISRSLVDQIDNLSAIAIEFSNFAKMPVTQNQQIDLIAQINNVVPLFAIDENKRAFRADFHGLEHAMIYADKEQVSRVFINLFKNALQAIPKDRQAEIHIDVLKINKIIWIRIKDNGLGIPEEMQEKIFRPNFTTKSSGMGMGLAIVRNIIETAGGTINFKTRPDKGTAFIISLPAIE